MNSGGTIPDISPQETRGAHRGLPAGSQRGSMLGARATGLLVSLALAVVLMLILASVATSRFRNLQHRLAASWFYQGTRQLASGNPETAVQDFRNALAFSRDSRDYQLQLAQALVAAGHTTEGREYLLSLWERHPGDGVLNLLLARLSAQAGKVGEAITYYRDAIYGQWPDDPEAHRRQTRFELSDFLLAHKMLSEDRVELISLSADMPKNPEMLTRLGAAFMAAGEPGEALKQFIAALQVDAHFGRALIGAGTAAYSSGDYRLAAQYLEAALHPRGHAEGISSSSQEAQSNDQLAQMLEISGAVLRMNPYDPHLGSSERARRVAANFRIALQRLQRCAGSVSSTLQNTGTTSGGGLSSPGETSALNPAMAELLAPADKFVKASTSRKFRQDLDAQNEIINWTWNAEQAAARYCRPLTGQDQALLLLANKHQQIQ